jgi:succinate dehydrogenase/fumarate reductase flavoprotein subunit
MHHVTTDVLVVGAEAAGKRAAISASLAGARVTLASKRQPGHGGVTAVSVGACAAFTRSGSGDSPHEHCVDTLRGGHFLGDQESAYALSHDASRRLRELRELGARFDAHPDGTLVQRLLPGHRYPRSVTFGTATGHEFNRVLGAQVRRMPIDVLEGLAIAELVVDDEGITGAIGLDTQSGEPVLIDALAVVLATGGIHSAYLPRGYPAEDLTADGLGMALRAGAELADLEFVQFFPTSLIWPPDVAGCIWVGELRYSCDAWLLNAAGERFMERYDAERMELSTRDVVSSAIAMEIAEARGTLHGGVWMSVAHVARERLESYLASMFPGDIFGGYDLRAAGIDVRTDRLEVAPVAHFHMGGLRVDAHARTSIPGLFAAGEVAAGVHGANRIENNALTETQVFGAVAGIEAARHVRSAARRAVVLGTKLRRAARDEIDYASIARAVSGIRRVMWEKVGVLRDGPGLSGAVEELIGHGDELIALSARSPYSLELRQARNLALVSEAIARSALARTESRGAHVRLDHPSGADPRWLLNLITTFADGRLALRSEPVTFSRVNP